MKETQEFTVWQNLRAVDTIYEEDYEFSSSSSSLSPPLSPPPPHEHLHSRVHQWSNVTGFKTDACIRVNGQCFHIHKDPLASKSPYLKRQLATASDVTVSPPLKITPKTFTLVADFCYGAPIVITPFNVAALRTAAELLEMSETENNTYEENLVYLTEKYFRRVVAVNRDYASVVFRSCLELLPEAETMAYLGSRCLEAWSLEDEGENGDITCFEDFKCVEIENFMVLASSLNRRFKCHDLIYNIALLYLKGHGGKITEDQKVLICNFIDCDKLSPKLLLHAVQNPVMPLRFVVRAMLIEQLNTRNSIFSTSTAAATTKPPPPRPIPKDPVTLGAILKRDAAARESAKLKAAMHATNSRIRTLESQLTSMKKKLQESEKQRSLSEDAGHGRSASFHYRVDKSNSNQSKVVARGQRGSTSSSVFRLSADFKTEYYKFGGGCKPFSERGSSSNHDGSRKSGRSSSSIGQRLINGIKNVFRVSSLGETESKVQSRDGEEEGEDLYEEEGEDDIVVMRRNQLYVN